MVVVVVVKGLQAESNHSRVRRASTSTDSGRAVSRAGAGSAADGRDPRNTWNSSFEGLGFRV